MTISGKIVINAAKKLIKKKKGSAALVIEKISWPVMPWSTETDVYPCKFIKVICKIDGYTLKEH